MLRVVTRYSHWSVGFIWNCKLSTRIYLV